MGKKTIADRDRQNCDFGNTKLHWIKGSRTACGAKVPGMVQRGWYVSEFGFHNRDNPAINCKKCRAAIAKAA